MLATPRRRSESPAAMVAAHGDHLALKAAPINPEWIIRGTPLARIGEHSTSADEASSTAVWDCTAGEFRWYFGWDETVVIQEGEVHVTDADGEERLLRAGDIAYFRGGTWATWRIDNYVRKVAFLRKPFPGPIAMLYRLRNALRQGKFSAL
ncbi:cupin [Rhizobium sp. Root274]|nr:MULTISPECIES: cupin domain-containing protein [unclassified Rhizobium]KQW32378.1 cupin [Rhizobium sp. Root1240]KRD33924.1 cupin [Rhizobium sp. Root274]